MKAGRQSRKEKNSPSAKDALVALARVLARQAALEDFRAGAGPGRSADHSGTVCSTTAEDPTHG
jgi:hypothetical protein